MAVLEYFSGSSASPLLGAGGLIITPSWQVMADTVFVRCVCVCVCASSLARCIIDGKSQLFSMYNACMRGMIRQLVRLQVHVAAEVLADRR